MTYRRRLALFLSRYRWYNPHLDKDSDALNEIHLDDSDLDSPDSPDGNNNDSNNVRVQVKTIDKPSLNVAWEYLEHFVLPRYIVSETEALQDDDLSVDRSLDNDDDLSESSVEQEDANNVNIASNAHNGGSNGNNANNTNKRKNFIRAEQGYFDKDKPTKLYPIFGTSDEDMSDFGIGVGLYFNTVKYLTIIMLIAGCICQSWLKEVTGKFVLFFLFLTSFAICLVSQQSISLRQHYLKDW